MTTSTTTDRYGSASAKEAAIRIRRAVRADADTLERLRQLDTRPLPAGELLVAETDGEILAARSLATGETIADPFRHTAHLRTLLSVRSAALSGRPAPRRKLALRLPWRYARAEAH